MYTLIYRYELNHFIDPQMHSRCRAERKYDEPAGLVASNAVSMSRTRQTNLNSCRAFQTQTSPYLKPMNRPSTSGLDRHSKRLDPSDQGNPRKCIRWLLLKVLPACKIDFWHFSTSGVKAFMLWTNVSDKHCIHRALFHGMHNNQDRSFGRLRIY